MDEIRKICVPYEVQGIERAIPYTEIYTTFAESRYGKKLQQEVRWSPYQPEDISNDEWKRLLGPDACNMRHARHVCNRARSLIYFSLQEDPFAYSLRDQEYICLTALSHDMGEYVVKDLPYGMKTKEIEEKEVTAIHEFTDELFSDQVIREKLHWVTDNVIDGKVGRRAGEVQPTLLQETFDDVIEHLDYVRTPLRAWHLHKQIQHPELRVRLRTMGHAIAPAHVQHLMKYAERFPAVRHYLYMWRDAIDAVLADDTEEVLRGFPLQGHGFNAEQIEEYRSEWEEWKKNR